MKAVLFSDLDGAFLDQRTYRPGPATGPLKALIQAGVTVVFCSAKTRAEMTHLLKQLDVDGPFIVENGAAVVEAGQVVACFGLPYQRVRAGLMAAAAEAGVRVRSYGEMTPGEISDITGLSWEEATRAQEREYSVTFLLEGSATSLAEALAKRGLRLVRGALFYSAQGEHDKGTALRYLADRLSPQRTYAIGDFDNDLPMLKVVEVPMLVQRPGGVYADLAVEGLVRLAGVGPEGWVLGAKRILADLSE
ncbi:MAG: HAD-IIB family hydrolase [Acidimicrobiia bacterium]